MRPALLVMLLALLGLSSLGAKCVKYNWVSDDDRAAYADVHWNDTPFYGQYAFAPDYPVRERELGPCFQHPQALIHRGGFNCTSFVLDVDLPSGTVEVDDVASLLDIFGPIDSEAEAASFAYATIGGYARYDLATAAAPNGNFLVRMMELRDNCSPTAGFYAIAYEITPSGRTRIAGEEPRRTPSDGSTCYD